MWLIDIYTNPVSLHGHTNVFINVHKLCLLFMWLPLPLALHLNSPYPTPLNASHLNWTHTITSVFSQDGLKYYLSTPGEFNAGSNPKMDQHPIMGAVEILPVAFGDQDTPWSDGPLGIGQLWILWTWLQVKVTVLQCKWYSNCNFLQNQEEKERNQIKKAMFMIFIIRVIIMGDWGICKYFTVKCAQASPPD